MRGVPRRLVAAALASSIAFALALVPALPASAHSYLQRSEPSDGATLTAAPTALHLYFSESVEFAATTIDIVDGAGRHFAPTSMSLARADDTQQGTEVPSEIVATLPPLGADAYRVSWRTVSKDDLHQTAGVLVFGVNQTIKASGWQETRPGLAEAALRFLLFLGLALGMGSLLLTRLLTRLRVLTEAAVVVSTARTIRAVGAAGALLAVTADVALLAEQVHASGLSLARVISGGYGAHWLVRTVGLVVLAAATVVRVRRPSGRSVTVAAWAGGTLAVAGNAWLGHAGASGSASRILADAAHVEASAIWAGALLTAAVAAAGGRKRVVVSAALRGFAVPAAICVAVMAVTGVFLASDAVGSVDAAILTVYGRVLLLKVAIVGVALLIGAGNYLRLRRTPASSSTRVRFVSEAVALTLAFAGAAVLLSGQPATQPQLVAKGSGATVPLIGAAVDDLQESVAVRPNLPGRNVVLVQALETRRPALAPITGMRLSVTSADGSLQQLSADNIGDGQWSVPVALADSNPVDIAVDVQRQGAPTTSHVYRWQVGSNTPPRAVAVSAAPLHTTLRVLAAALAVCILLAGVMTTVRRRRRTRRLAARVLSAEADDVLRAVAQKSPREQSRGTAP